MEKEVADCRSWQQECGQDGRDHRDCAYESCDVGQNLQMARQLILSQLARKRTYLLQRTPKTAVKGLNVSESYDSSELSGTSMRFYCTHFEKPVRAGSYGKFHDVLMRLRSR